MTFILGNPGGIYLVTHDKLWLLSYCTSTVFQPVQLTWPMLHCYHAQSDVQEVKSILFATFKLSSKLKELCT